MLIRRILARGRSDVTDHLEARFSHRICPHCFEKFMRPELKKRNKTGGNP
jgi:hypothetical protein